jgi:hypothetical protein
MVRGSTVSHRAVRTKVGVSVKVKPCFASLMHNGRSGREERVKTVRRVLESDSTGTLVSIIPLSSIEDYVLN